MCIKIYIFSNKLMFNCVVVTEGICYSTDIDIYTNLYKQ